MPRPCWAQSAPLRQARQRPRLLRRGRAAGCGGRRVGAGPSCCCKPLTVCSSSSFFVFTTVGADVGTTVGGAAALEGCGEGRRVVGAAVLAAVGWAEGGALVGLKVGCSVFPSRKLRGGSSLTS